MTEDEMVGWHHRLNGHGFGWSLEAGDGQGGLACCSSWGCKELDTTERLNCLSMFLPLWLVANLQYFIHFTCFRVLNEDAKERVEG